MSKFFKFFKNLEKVKTTGENLTSFKQPNKSIQVADMAAQVVLNNGLKIPRMGRKCLTNRSMTNKLPDLWDIL